MPKLLFINTTCNHGSTGKISEQLGLMMIERGWEVYCACGERLSNPSKLKVIKISSTLGIYFHKLISLIFDSEGKGSIIATKRLVAKIKKINPDVIHLHNIHGHYINYKILFEYLKESGKPVVWTLHDCWPMTGHCTHFVTANCAKWKTECYCCPLIKDYPSSLVFDRSRNNWLEKKNIFASLEDVVIVPVSHWLENIVKESFLRRYPSIAINNGIDLQVFKPSSTIEPNLKFTILGVANLWTDNKGLKEFEQLSRNNDYKIILIGGKPRGERVMPDGVQYIPRTNSQKELAAYYSQADVLVNPTYADSFPTINMEAIACGTPVITYRTGGSPESVPSEVGYVVEKGNISALVEAIEKLRNNPIPSETCRKYAEEHFDKDKCFSEYVKLYESFV